MGTIRIAHLSDLHFVPSKSDAQVWSLVRDFINERVKPHAVLVTGDVTDSATQAEFDFASQSLGSLAVQSGGDNLKFRIVAGNHDRYLYRGNRIPLVGRLWPLRRLERDKSARFDHAFPGAMQITPKAPCDMTLIAVGAAGQAAVPWKVRVIGLDSSAEAQWFAQGAISNSNVQLACNAAADHAAREHDLVIALVHHHILPIPAVEQKKIQGGGFSKLLDCTGLLNAGALIEGLSRTQVDLVLHGHEHAQHQARFTGSDERATSVALLAAGSATGDDTHNTVATWDLKRVHFNVIELDDDRSVWLRQVAAPNGELSFQPGRRLVLHANEIRASRFVRRNRQTADGDPGTIRKLPHSRLRMQVEFHSNRDIQMTETRNDWQVSPLWTPTTSSASGRVGPAVVQFDWKDGERNSFQAAAQRHGPHPDDHAFAVRVPNSSAARGAHRVTARWTWAGAAAFTRAELAMLPDTAKRGTRGRGEESASVLCPDEFADLVLSVRLPLQFSSPPEAIRAYYEKPGSSEQTYSEELRQGLEICGPGNWELRVPYPMPGYRYGISWPVLERDMRNPQAPAFSRGLLSRRQALQSLLDRQLAARGWSASCRWAIYEPDAAAMPKLRRSISSGDASPQLIVLADARGLARAAFWGDAVVARADEGDDGKREMLQDEVLLGYFALRERRELTYQALAILRIAFTSDPVGAMDEGTWFADFKAFANLTALVLGAAVLGQVALL